MTSVLLLNLLSYQIFQQGQLQLQDGRPQQRKAIHQRPLHSVTEHHQRKDIPCTLVLVRQPDGNFERFLRLPHADHRRTVSQGEHPEQQDRWIKETSSTNCHQTFETLQTWRLVRPESGEIF